MRYLGKVFSKDYNSCSNLKRDVLVLRLGISALKMSSWSEYRLPVRRPLRYLNFEPRNLEEIYISGPNNLCGLVKGEASSLLSIMQFPVSVTRSIAPRGAFCFSSHL
jgi:hypothetical protein